MAAEPVLRTDGLEKYYEESAGLVSSLLGSKTYIRAVDGVDIEIYPNEVYGLVGESGSGKSTIGEVVIRLEEPTGGRIYYKGEDVGEYSRSELRQFRKHAQIIFQDPYGSVNPKKTVLQTVAEPLKNFGVAEGEVETRVTEMLHDVGLRPPRDFLYSYPNQLSGGQRQRVNIARALVLEPDLLIADEPMSMLDVSIQSGIMKILNRLQDELGFAMLYISHDLSVVRMIADRIGVLYRGKVVESGAAEQVMRDPKHPYTRALMDSLPDLSRRRERVILDTDADDDADRQPTGCGFYPRCPDRMDVCAEAVPALAEAADRQVRCYLHHDRTADGERVDVDGDAHPEARPDGG
jgi:peptide/nickel transport system ATP-binding protein